MGILKLQLLCKLFDHIIYGNIKTRYNVFRKYANDVFDECDFVAKRITKSYIIRLLVKPPALKPTQSLLTHRDDGLILLTRLASELADSLCVDYLAQVTTPW